MEITPQKKTSEKEYPKRKKEKARKEAQDTNRRKEIHQPPSIWREMKKRMPPSRRTKLNGLTEKSLGLIISKELWGGSRKNPDSPKPTTYRKRIRHRTLGYPTFKRRKVGSQY